MYAGNEGKMVGIALSTNTALCFIPGGTLNESLVKWMLHIIEDNVGVQLFRLTAAIHFRLNSFWFGNLHINFSALFNLGRYFLGIDNQTVSMLYALTCGSLGWAS